VTDETKQETFKRGQDQGKTDALLIEHSAHLAKINGSVERAAKAEEALTVEIHKLGVETRQSLEKIEDELRSAIRAVASDVRTLNEDARLRDERVKVAADTLATETERRREELASAGASHAWEFTKRQQTAALIVAVAAIIVTILIATNHL